MASPSLEQTLTTTAALISHLQDTLKNIETSAPASSDKLINPLALSSTAASLIKAQTTKLTLLALNKPFTPSSIVQILNTISTSPLPALVTSVQICEPSKFGRFARHELRNRASRLLGAYKNLLAEIPTSSEALEGKILASKVRNPSGNDGLDQKAALIGTGLVWEVCDELVTFSEQGVGEMAGKKLSSYRALFNDALEEIDEWLESGRNSKDVEDVLEDLTLGSEGSDSGSIGSFRSRPSKEIIPVADWALNVLNHITLLYPPIIKRRVKRFPELNGKTAIDAIPSEQTSRLDEMLDAGKAWSEQIDLIAESLLENDAEAATSRVHELVASAEEQTQVTKNAWNGSEDEFTAWIVQWTKKLSDIKSKGQPSV